MKKITKRTIFISLLLMNYNSFGMINGEVHLADDTPESHLIAASAKNDLITVKELLDNGANVNVSKSIPFTNNHPHEATFIFTTVTTPLFEAIRQRNSDIVKLLIERGANVNATEQTTGASPLNIASKASWHSIEIMQALIKAGANPNQIDLNGHVPLRRTIRGGNIEATLLLLAAGADPFLETGINYIDNHGISRTITPSMYAQHREIRTILKNLEVSQDEQHSILSSTWVLKQTNPPLIKDVRGIIKRDLVQRLVQEKLQKIKNKIPPSALHTVDMPLLEKAIRVFIMRALGPVGPVPKAPRALEPSRDTSSWCTIS